MRTKPLFVFLVLPLLLQGMSLEETIDQALQYNNTLKKIHYTNQQTEALRDSKKSQNYGKLNLLAGYDHYNMARTLAPLTPMDIVGGQDGAYKIPATHDLASAGIAYSVTLFDGFSQKNSYEISDLLHKGTALKEKLATNEVVYNVKNIYVTLLSLREQLKAQKLFTHSQEKLYQQIKKAYELGKRSKLDMLKAHNAFLSSSSL